MWRTQRARNHPSLRFELLDAGKDNIAELAVVAWIGWFGLRSAIVSTNVFPVASNVAVFPEKACHLVTAIST